MGVSCDKTGAVVLREADAVPFPGPRGDTFVVGTGFDPVPPGRFAVVMAGLPMGALGIPLAELAFGCVLEDPPFGVIPGLWIGARVAVGEPVAAVPLVGAAGAEGVGAVLPGTPGFVFGVPLLAAPDVGFALVLTGVTATAPGTGC